MDVFASVNSMDESPSRKPIFKDSGPIVFEFVPQNVDETFSDPGFHNDLEGSSSILSAA